MYHLPVLAKEATEYLIQDKGGVYVDLTFGGGGHSRQILEHLHSNAKLYGFDQDKDAANELRDLNNDNRFSFVRGNFRFVKNFLNYYGVESVDGILADLGVSSHQFDTAERGFSYRFTSDLDMRMNVEQKNTAFDIIHTATEEELITIFKEYGELPCAKKLANKITCNRNIEPIDTTEKLMALLSSVLPKHKGETDKQLLSQVFQSLRIAVNDELQALEDMLEQSGKLLKKGGRLVVITYHSLEDRYVKNYIKAGNVQNNITKDFYGNVVAPLQSILKKPIVPKETEILENRRSRSAKMRVGEKIE